MRARNEMAHGRGDSETGIPYGFDIVGALAVRYGVDVEAVIDELAGSTTLARFARDLLGLQSLERKPGKRGRKADADNNWAMFSHVSARLKTGSTLDEAVALYLVSKGVDDPDVHDATARQFRRLKRKGWEPVTEIAALFVGPPAD